MACSGGAEDLGQESAPISFHPEVLGIIQQRVLRYLAPLMAQWHFYLGGGTAVALHLGHRRSLDLDWFTEESIRDPMRLAQDLRDEGLALRTGQIARGTLHGTVSGTPVSFLEYRYPLLEPTAIWEEHGCLLASLDDLVCMKLAAITQRGSKKDFVDLYALGMKHRSLKEMLSLYQQKYSMTDIAHVLYGLAYFDDANKERMPVALWDMDWRTIKKVIREWIKELVG